ncbi:MAG: HYR domain-containing protein [Blastocatellales bacterium]
MLYEPRVTHTRVAFPHGRFLSRAILLVFLFVVAVSVLQLGRSARAHRFDSANGVVGALAGARDDGAVAQLDPNQPHVGPGVAQVGSNSPRSAASSTKAGSVLFFHKYTSDTARANVINTLITVTNTNPRDSVIVRVFFVHDSVFEDQFVTLVANQSRTLVAGKESPNMTGYVMAVAVNSQGLPAQFNWLIGSASLRDDRGHEASYNAFTVAKRSGGPVNFNIGGLSSDIKFDNADYDRLPKVAAIDSLQNQDPVSGPAVATDVAIYSPLADMTGVTQGGYKLAATAFDDSGNAFTQELDVASALNASVSEIWSATPFNMIISANRLGWANFSARGGDPNAPAPIPVLGLSLTDGVDSPMHNARNMQALEWLDSFSVKIPARLPENPVADVVTQDQPSAPNGAQGASETKAGSILLYPRFVSGASGNSQIYVTNTHPTQQVRLRVFFTGLTDPAEVKESIIKLPALQTTVLQADDLAPNQRGWVMVMAIDNRALPIQFNHLVGSAQVHENGGQKASFNAFAIAKNTPDATPRDKDLTTASLQFNDEIFDRWPATTALSFVPSQVDNSSLLGFSRPSNSLLDPPNTRGVATVMLYDESLTFFGANVARTENKLNQIRPSLLQPPITNTILPGQHGWLKLLSTSPVFSWSLNMATAPFTAAGGSWSGGFSGDGNLHVLTTADSFTLTVPAVNPNNRPPFALAATLPFQIEARRADGTIVRLDGSSSGDEDFEDPLTYEWTDNDTTISTARIADSKLSLGSHTIRLVVTDGSGVASFPAEQTVTVVDTTSPQISGVPSAISKVTDSDSGEAISFPSPVAYDMVDGAIAVTASNASGSVFPLGRTVVTFTAKDNAGNLSQAMMEVTLTKGATQPPTGGVPGDKAPVMDNINDQYVRIGEIRNVVLQASDADGDAVIFSLQGEPSHVQIIGGDPSSRTATLRIAPRQGDTAASTNVRVVVNDGRGESFTTLPFRIIISDVPNDDTGGGGSLNRAPVAVIAPLPGAIQATSKVGADVTLDATGSSDPDGDSISYQWYDYDVLVARGSLATVSLAVGTHSIRLVAFDGKDGLTITEPIAIEVEPRPLTAASASPNTLNRDTTATLTIIGTGFNSSTWALFSKEGISIANYVSIEEDKIVVNIAISATATPGFRDIYVVNPNGRSVRLRSALFVSP